MTQLIDYSVLIQHKGAAYQQSQVVSGSYYNDPIDQTVGRLAGDSRIVGDASANVQAQVIDILIDESRKAGLNDHQTAYVLAIAREESGFNPDAAAGTMSASGLGQFTNGTGSAYGLNNTDRWDARAQAQALVQYYQDNARLAQQRGQGEEYIYKYHHDGASGDYGGLTLSNNDIMPYLNQYENFVKTYPLVNGSDGVTPFDSNTPITLGLFPLLDAIDAMRKGYYDNGTQCVPPDDNFLTTIQGLFHRAEITSSPLVLDLNGDGVSTIAMSAGVHFDQNNNRFAELGGWVNKDDGLLVRDLNGNGQIDGGSELFGNNTTLASGQKAANGFASLAELDTNHDGNVHSLHQAMANDSIWLIAA